MFDSIGVATAAAGVLVFVNGLFAGLNLSSWILEQHDDIATCRRIRHKAKVSKMGLIGGTALLILFYAAVAALSVGILSMSIRWTVDPSQGALLGISEFSAIYLFAVVMGHPLAVKTKI